LSCIVKRVGYVFALFRVFKLSPLCFFVIEFPILFTSIKLPSINIKRAHIMPPFTNKSLMYTECEVLA